MSLRRKASILQSSRVQSDMIYENNSASNSKIMSRVESRDNSIDMIHNSHEIIKKTANFSDNTNNMAGKESQKSSVHSNTGADFQEQLLAQIYEASISQQRTISQNISNDADSISDVLEQNLRDLNFYYGMGKYLLLKTNALCDYYPGMFLLPFFLFSQTQHYEISKCYNWFIPIKFG